MSKEKQIDEIAKLICTYPQCVHYNIIGECKNTVCQTVDFAEHLYNSGYRKQSEVVREIFEEIEKFTHRFLDDFNYLGGDLVYDIAELKKKYTEERK